MNGVMMLFSLYDVKAEAFMRPWCAPTKAFAIRSISDQLMDANSELAKHPSDYTLFCVGKFCEETGEITPDKVPLGTCIEFYKEVYPKSEVVEPEKDLRIAK